MSGVDVVLQFINTTWVLQIPALSSFYAHRLPGCLSEKLTIDIPINFAQYSPRDIRLRPQSPTKNNLTPPLFIPRSEYPPHFSSTNKPNTMAKIGSIIPLIILFIVIAILAAIGFVAYSIAHDVGKQTRQKLERKNVSFSRDGMKVGVKEVSIEQQEDKTQRYGYPNEHQQRHIHTLGSFFLWDDVG